MSSAEIRLRYLIRECSPTVAMDKTMLGLLTTVKAQVREAELARCIAEVYNYCSHTGPPNEKESCDECDQIVAAMKRRKKYTISEGWK